MHITKVNLLANNCVIYKMFSVKSYRWSLEKLHVNDAQTAITIDGTDPKGDKGIFVGNNTY